MIKRIDHIAFAVKDLEKAITHAKKYGGKHLFTSHVEKDGYVLGAVQLGECILTYLQPVKEDSFVKAFIDRKGEGIHHIGLEAENIEDYVSKLESGEIKLPVQELEGDRRKEVLVSPEDSFGTIFQIIEWKGGADMPLEKRIERMIEYRT